MSDALPLDAGLQHRFEEAGRKIEWRDAPAGPRRAPRRRRRIAHLHDEEARVESWGPEASGAVAVDPGPVGALVIVLECFRRGPPAALGATDAGSDPAFPGGRIVAAWGREPVPSDSTPRLLDLVELARYALA